MKFPELVEKISEELKVPSPRVRKIIKQFLFTLKDLVESDSEDDKIVTPSIVIKRKVIPAKEDKPEIRRLFLDIKKVKEKTEPESEE